jgi:hypothetical protein
VREGFGAALKKKWVRGVEVRSQHEENMSTKFIIPSSDPELLEQARRVAREFTQKYVNDDMVGIVFLGGVARGYFDHSADIDIALFKKQGAEIPLPAKFLTIDDFPIQIWLEDYESEKTSPWEMPKRWTYSQGQIFFDTQDQIAQLLNEKVPLGTEEKKWLMMSGLTLSEWYINRLTHLWIERGNLISAHHMFQRGLNYFFDMLFALNEELVPDMKWRYYCVEQLERLPHNFQEHIKDTLIMHSASLEEIERRQAAFMEMWREMKPIIEQELCMSFDEMVQLT